MELNDLRCPLCNTSEETTTHLFFNCNKTLPLWWESLQWINTRGVFPQNPKDHFLQHVSGSVAGTKATRWQCWWVALTWTIWKHRNGVIFANQTFKGSKVMEDAIFLLWTWLKLLEKGFTLHFNHWSSHLTVAFCN